LLNKGNTPSISQKKLRVKTNINVRWSDGIVSK
jgi:hypothetical protein